MPTISNNKPINLLKRMRSDSIHNIKEMDSRARFSHWTKRPFLDSEAQKILRLDENLFEKETKLGRLKRSISLDLHPSVSITFVGLFDLFEFFLWKSLHMSSHRAHDVASELVNSLVDEFHLAMDEVLTIPRTDFSRGYIQKRLENLCSENAREWTAFWLYCGDRFCPRVCVSLTLGAWESLCDAIHDVTCRSGGAQHNLQQNPQTAG